MSGAHALRASGTSRAVHSGSDSKTNPDAFHVRMSVDVRIGITPRPLPPVQKT